MPWVVKAINPSSNNFALTIFSFKNIGEDTFVTAFLVKISILNIEPSLHIPYNCSFSLKSNKIKVWTKLNLPSIKSIEYIKKVIESDTNQYIEEYLEEEKNIRH